MLTDSTTGATAPHLIPRELRARIGSNASCGCCIDALFSSGGKTWGGRGRGSSRRKLTWKRKRTVARTVLPYCFKDRRTRVEKAREIRRGNGTKVMGGLCVPGTELRIWTPSGMRGAPDEGDGCVGRSGTPSRWDSGRRAGWRLGLSFVRIAGGISGRPSRGRRRARERW